MYKITTVEGDLILQTDDPRFVKLNPNSGAWIRCTPEFAQCIAVNGVRYSLAGREPVEDAPIVAFVQKVDAGTLQLNTDNKVDSQNADIDTLAWALNKMASEVVEFQNRKQSSELSADVLAWALKKMAEEIVSQNREQYGKDV